AGVRVVRVDQHGQSVLVAVELAVGDGRIGGQLAYPPHWPAPGCSLSFSCSRRHMTLPEPDLGRLSTNSTTCGTLYAAMCSRAQLRMSSALVEPRASSRSTITALTDSPRYGSRVPITQASSTAGCLNSIVSTSAGQTL